MTSHGHSPQATPLILDVDTGIDDALALLYSCASPEAELVAVTCVSGNVDARQAAVNTLAVLELAGRVDIEVALGREVPLVRPLRTAPETHGPRGLGYAELPEPRASASPRHAADLIVAEAEARPGEITLVTLGPLTNLALAVLREPRLPHLIRRLVMMAGSYRSAGNTAPTSEWNVAIDPEAAKIVLAAFGGDDRGARGVGAVPARPLALGLDVTERAKLTREHLDRLARAAAPLASDPAPGRRHGDVVRFVSDALRFYMEFHSRYDRFYGAFIHDPLAVAVALDPGLVRTEALAVDVELAGTLTTGETVADWRRTWGRPPNVEVAVEAETDRFIDRFVDRLAALARARAGVPEGRGDARPRMAS